MKIRNGFVSNSSSSSFVIYGIIVSAKELIEKLKLDEKNIYEDMDEKASNFGLEIATINGDEEYFIVGDETRIYEECELGELDINYDDTDLQNKLRMIGFGGNKTKLFIIQHSG